MNYFKQKLLWSTFVFLCAITTLEAEQNPLSKQNPFKDLIDNNLEGFFLSGGVGYGIERGEVSEHDLILRNSSARAQWKVGYVTSIRLGVYLVSPFTEFTPKFGAMWYPGQKNRSSRHYLQALIGFSDDDFYSGAVVKSLEGGFGYEFRPHFVFDVAAGYNRRLVRIYHSVIYRDTGIVLVDTHELTLLVSVNYRFY